MSDPWYEDGLHFTCTRCGNCCRGEPGVVWVSEEELASIADFRREPVGEVEAMYTRIVQRKRSLREQPNGDCVFWEQGKGCTIYPVRPRQCRTWPFWESTLETPETWETTKNKCPGAGQGELISSEEITRRMRVISV